MIELHLMSAANEFPVAERLKQLIVQTWPGVDSSTGDRIDMFLGVRTPCDIDLLVVVDRARPRAYAQYTRPDGTQSSFGSVQHAIIAMEVKQLDVRSFRRLGNQLYPIYDGIPKERSVSAQAKDAAEGLKRFIGAQSAAVPFVYALGWLTEVDRETLRDMDPLLVGAESDWAEMLDTCVRQYDGILRAMSRESALALPGLRARLLNRRLSTRRDAKRVESLSLRATAAKVDGIMDVVGRKQVQLIGRGGSGKTTTLALVAVRLAEAGERILILTYHKTLRGDIEHLIRSLCSRMNVPAERIVVDTTMAFVLRALTGLGGSVPLNADGTDVNWKALDAALDDTRSLLLGTADDRDSDVAQLRSREPRPFDWDYIFVDEAQDSSDAERDFLRALFPTRKFVLSDGMDQLVRRARSCDWIASVASEDRERFSLDLSQRMLRNVALFACAVAHAAGFETWSITPHEELPGGRVIIVEGANIDAAMLRAIVDAAAVDRADPADCLVCIPPKRTVTGDRARDNVVAAAAEASIALWDGRIAENRDAFALTSDSLRVLRYDSCRGLEG